MKIKLIALLAASMSFLVGCGNNGGNTSTEPAPTTSTPATPIEFLSFVEKGKIRIDTFDVDVQFSFGNAALANPVNTTDLKADGALSVNGDSTAEKSYNFIYFAEKEGRHTFRYLSPKGNELTTFVELNSVKNFFKDYDSERGYVAISVGATPTWTKGLSAKMDAYISAELSVL